MLTTKLYLNPSDYNYVLINFFEPFVTKSLKSKSHYYFFRKDFDMNFPHLYFEFHFPTISSKFKYEIQKSWKSFYNHHHRNLCKKKENSSSSIFKGFPIGYMEINEYPDETFDLFYCKRDISNSSLKILQFMDNKNDDYWFEILLITTLTFVYSLGAFSELKFKKIINELNKSLDFSVRDFQIMNEEAEKVFKSNRKYLGNLIAINLDLLYNFEGNPGTSTNMTNLKYTYGILASFSNDNNLGSTNLYNIYKSQIGLSDAKAYVILKILKDSIDL